MPVGRLRTVASETLIKRLQALQANSMISDEQYAAMREWSDRLARTTARLGEIVASQDGSPAAQDA